MSNASLNDIYSRGCLSLKESSIRLISYNLDENLLNDNQLNLHIPQHYAVYILAIFLKFVTKTQYLQYFLNVSFVCFSKIVSTFPEYEFLSENRLSNSHHTHLDLLLLQRKKYIYFQYENSKK